MKVLNFHGQYLYSLLEHNHIASAHDKWLQRLIAYAQKNRVVLRTVFVSRRQYIKHLRNLRDWKFRRESRGLCSALDRVLKKNKFEKLWMVEFSVPELFPVNLRKLGEIVLDAGVEAELKLNYETFLFARFPGKLLAFAGVGRDKKPDFEEARIDLKSHTQLFSNG